MLRRRKPTVAVAALTAFCLFAVFGLGAIPTASADGCTVVVTVQGGQQFTFQNVPPGTDPNTLPLPVQLPIISVSQTCPPPTSTTPSVTVTTTLQQPPTTSTSTSTSTSTAPKSSTTSRTPTTSSKPTKHDDEDEDGPDRLQVPHEVHEPLPGERGVARLLDRREGEEEGGKEEEEVKEGDQVR